MAPAHNPPYIAAMKAFERELPGVPLVAVMEPFPYRFMDEASTTYAVPYEWRTEHGIRRYGFHGASHRSANERATAFLGRKDLRHISCHLGGSSSLCAIRDGASVALLAGDQVLDQIAVTTTSLAPGLPRFVVFGAPTP